MAIGAEHPVARRGTLPRAGRLRFRHGLAAVLALALIARVLVIVATPQFAPATDAVDYDRIAVSLADTGGFPSSYLAPKGGPTAFRPPMFPLALAGAYQLSGTSDAKARWRAGRSLEALLGTIAVGLIALIALRLWGPGVALLAGAIAAVYPPLLLVGSSLMTESLFIPLALGTVLCGLVYRDPGGGRLRWVVLAGVLIAIASLTRTDGIVLLAPVGVMVWTARPRSSRRALSAPLTLIAAIAIALVPWTVRNAHVLHAFVPTTTQSGYGLAGTYEGLAQHRRDYPALWVPPVLEMLRVYRTEPTANEAEVSNRLDTIGLDYIKAHPSSLLHTAYWDTVRLFNLGGTGFETWDAKYEGFPRRLAEVSVYAFWLLALVAIGGAFTRAARTVPKSLWWCPVVLLLGTVMFSGSTRYRAPADPFFVMLAALGLREAWGRLRPAPVPSPPG
jgi:4-amino-4-deoxy-L-arabinose transferase-like glycosyltransferase